MVVKSPPPPYVFNQIEYPESDGQNMAETGIHVTVIAYLLTMLRIFFQNRNVYVGANMLMYYEEGEPKKCVAPDLFVALNTKTDERRSWFTWKESKAPEVIFEFTSKSTRTEDRGSKKGLYEVLGVKEYFLFDPLDEYLIPRLQGFRLVNGEYRPISLVDSCLQSEVLGLTLGVEGAMLTLTNTKTGEQLLPPAALANAYQHESAARRAAEEEVARLRAELEQLKSGKN
ncbi:MAG: Uma2 family endonuclease [Chloroflexi bacterium]|nr:Uma2 family endonuclease [Chloroflexota bacterium]